jgi:hypothetical protein
VACGHQSSANPHRNDQLRPLDGDTGIGMCPGAGCGRRCSARWMAGHQRRPDRRVGGGGVGAHTHVVTGLAGLVAGAFSMGTGEYVSVTNQNELVHAEVAVERDMHARFPEEERAELAERFASYGADTDTARRMAAAVSRDAQRAVWLHARDELGVDPRDLPSPLLAGGASLVAFLGRRGLAAAAVSGRVRGVAGGARPDRGCVAGRRDGGGTADRAPPVARRTAAAGARRLRNHGHLRRWAPHRRRSHLTAASTRRDRPDQPHQRPGERRCARPPGQLLRVLQPPTNNVVQPAEPGGEARHNSGFEIDVSWVDTSRARSDQYLGSRCQGCEPALAWGPALEIEFNPDVIGIIGQGLAPPPASDRGENVHGRITHPRIGQLVSYRLDAARPTERESEGSVLVGEAQTELGLPCRAIFRRRC